MGKHAVRRRGGRIARPRDPEWTGSAPYLRTESKGDLVDAERATARLAGLVRFEGRDLTTEESGMGATGFPITAAHNIGAVGTVTVFGRGGTGDASSEYAATLPDGVIPQRRERKAPISAVGCPQAAVSSVATRWARG